jgi:hypothetical protein
MRRTVHNLLFSLSVLVLLAGTSAREASAQKKKKPAAGATAAAPAPAPGPKKARTFDFGAMSFEGTMRTPQLLYFLGRVKQELDRASLEKRSFMPELQRTVDEGGM